MTTQPGSSPAHGQSAHHLPYALVCVPHLLGKQGREVGRLLVTLGLCNAQMTYYLHSISIGESLAYPPRLAVDLGSYVDGEAHGWARQPYGYFDPAPRPRDIIHTYSYVPTAPSGAPHERVKAR